MYEIVKSTEFTILSPLFLYDTLYIRIYVDGTLNLNVFLFTAPDDVKPDIIEAAKNGKCPHAQFVPEMHLQID